MTLVKKAIGTVCVAAMLSGCVTDPYTGEKKPSKAAIGAVAGAIVGAATSSKSDRKKGALIGAAAGAGIGAYMDNQEQKLRKELEGTGVSVTRNGNTIELNMPGNLTFETDSSNIQSNFYSTLNAVGKVFQEFDDTNVRIAGHTDSTGSDSYNQTLSEKRASSVASYLVNQGVARERMQVLGWGESKPIASNETPAGRQQNRRVEIEIVPQEDAGAAS